MTTGEGSSSRRPRGSIGVRGQSAFTPYTRPPPSPDSSRASGSSAGGFTGGVGAQPVAVGASGSGGVVVQVGGSPLARKRVRDGGAGGGGNPPAVNCSVCGKGFMTPKALFGHMRSHPGRGWRGARPPPTFRAEEEFADIRPIEDDYRLPDLNNPPPDEDSAN